MRYIILKVSEAQVRLCVCRYIQRKETRKKSKKKKKLQKKNIHIHVFIAVDEADDFIEGNLLEEVLLQGAVYILHLRSLINSYEHLLLLNVGTSSLLHSYTIAYLSLHIARLIL